MPAAKAGTYKIRHRKMLPWRGYEHTDTNWRLSVYDVRETDDATSNSRHIIRGLTLREIYAVQLSYETVTGERVYAGRDAYLWPSDGFPPHGKRLATYPFFGHHGDKDYAYRICAETFFPDDLQRQSDWVALIEHAFEQWELATSGFITVTPEKDPATGEYEACTDMSRWRWALLPGIVRDEDDHLSETPRSSES